MSFTKTLKSSRISAADFGILVGDAVQDHQFNVFDMLGQLEDLVNCFEIDLTVFLKGGARNCECRMFEMTCSPVDFC